MSVQNGERLVTKQDLADMYQGILPYLGGMPEILANKFSKGDMYSTDERMIGQWIDGKPLYQKTIVGTASNNTIIFNVSDSIIVNYFGKIGNYTLSWYDSSSWYIRVCILENSKLKTFMAGFSNLVYNITVQYTKTTDSPISIGNETDYSTEEKIIGTWIDGKPIYQKTIEITPTSSGAQIATEVDALIDAPIITRKYSSEDPNLIVTSCGVTGDHTIAFKLIDNILYAIVVSPSKYSAGIAKITVQYTKTTN